MLAHLAARAAQRHEEPGNHGQDAVADSFHGRHGPVVDDAAYLVPDGGALGPDPEVGAPVRMQDHGQVAAPGSQHRGPSCRERPVQDFGKAGFLVGKRPCVPHVELEKRGVADPGVQVGRVRAAQEQRAQERAALHAHPAA
jgi:hypothetical protein